LRKIFSSRQAWALFLCHFGLVGNLTGFIGSWGVPYAIEVFDMSRLEASRLMMYSLIGSIAGAPIVSWLASKHGNFKRIYAVVHVCAFLSWVGWFMSGVTPAYIWVVIFIVITGMALGGSSLTFAVLRQSFPADEVGVATGFANMGGFLSAILLPMIFGNVLDLFPQDAIHIGYHYAFLIPVIFSFMGLLGALIIKEERKEVQAAGVSSVH
jgi:MFS family permease